MLILALDEVLATDPPVSGRQRRAMFAARAGRSALGIPKSVGEEFVGKDMKDADWDGLVRGLLKFLSEEKEEAGHAEDSNLLAFDRSSVRTLDADGRMRVALTNISKANVCDYWGREIPDYAALGLVADKTYRLLRDPEELKRAAPSFNGLQLLIKHVPVNADDHQPDLTVGTTGTEARFEDPYLQNSLVIWAKEGIELIESAEQKELSSAYRYRADMTPGDFKGQPYDGVMRDICGNHVALVREGRAGSDVVVGDSIPNPDDAAWLRLEREILLDQSIINPTKETNPMSVKTAKPAPLSRKAAVLKGALLVTVPVLLAQDAKAKLDTAMFDAVLAEIDSKNFKAKAPGLKIALDALVKPHLAKDADIGQLAKVVDAFTNGEEAEDVETEPNGGLPIKKKEGEDAEEQPWEKVRAKLKGGGMDAEKIKALDVEMGYEPKAEDAETDEEKATRLKKEADDKKARDAEKPVTKAAMDAALVKNTKAVREQIVAEQKALREAENFVRPYIGDIVMAHDSAEAVYRTALTTLRPEMKLDGIDPSAFKAMISLIPAPDKARAVEPLAMDAKDLNDFETMFPDTKRFRR